MCVREREGLTWVEVWMAAKLRNMIRWVTSSASEAAGYREAAASQNQEIASFCAQR